MVRYLGYGSLLLDRLVFFGFYPRVLSTYWPVGGIDWGSILQIFGYHIVRSGFFGGRDNFVFEDSVLSGDKLIALFVTTFFDWSRA